MQILTKELIVAAVMTLITGPLAAYAIWYVVRGRYLREKRRHELLTGKKDEKEDDKKTGKNGRERWGVDTKAYCYPEINDTMGFDFVKVVKVDESLLSRKQPTTTQKQWKESVATGMKKVTTESTENKEKHRDYDTELPDEPDSRKNQDARDLPEEDTTSSINAETLANIQAMSMFGGWQHHYDEEETEDYFDQMDRIMEDGESRNMIEKPTDAEEADRIARQSKEQEEYLKMMDALRDGNPDEEQTVGDEIMSELYEKFGDIDEQTKK